MNDYRPTKEAFNQLQGLRGYYRFSDVDIDEYVLDDNLTQVFCLFVKWTSQSLKTKHKNWINTKLKYLHGYGVAMAPVNQLTSSGQPEMVMKKRYCRFKAITKIWNWKNLQIYFGELASDYVIVNTKELEFDYPKGGNQ